MIDQNDIQIGGDHYKVPGQTEHWDFVWQHDLDYFQGQITKYVTRWKKKGGLRDLEKARHFLDKYIQLIQQRQEKEKQAFNKVYQEQAGANKQSMDTAAQQTAVPYPYPTHDTTAHPNPFRR